MPAESEATKALEFRRTNKDTALENAKATQHEISQRRINRDITDEEIAAATKIKLLCRNIGPESVLGQGNCAKLFDRIKELVLKRLDGWNTTDLNLDRDGTPDGHVNGEVDYMYLGKEIVDFATMQTKDTFGRPVCNVLHGLRGAPGEEQTNSLGESCGQPVKMDVTWGGSVNVYANPPNGTLEVALYRGALAQSLRFFTLKALKRLKDFKELPVSTLADGSRPCAVHAVAFNRVETRNKTEMDNAIAVSGGIDEAAQIKCASTEGSGREIASHFACRSGDIEQRRAELAAYFVRCEALAQRTNDLEVNFGIFEQFSGRARQAIEPVIRRGPCLDCGWFCSPGDYEDSIRKCYKPELIKFVKQEMRRYDTADLDRELHL